MCRGVRPPSRRIRLPTAVVLLLSGVLVGPHGLALFGGKAPIADFFADLGKLLLMFFGGLEIDLEQFRQAQNRSLLFGVITTSLPLVLRTPVGLWSGYQPFPAIVIGSRLASHP